MKEVVIVSAVRTPIGSIGGTLKNTLPEKLLATPMRALSRRPASVSDMFDEGQCRSGQADHRRPQHRPCLLPLMLQIPEATPPTPSIVSAPPACRPCSPSMQQIQCDYSDIMLCGGVESMSTAPLLCPGNVRFGVGNGNQAPGGP